MGSAPKISTANHHSSGKSKQLTPHPASPNTRSRTKHQARQRTCSNTLCSLSHPSTPGETQYSSARAEEGVESDHNDLKQAPKQHQVCQRRGDDFGNVRIRDTYAKNINHLILYSSEVGWTLENRRLVYSNYSNVDSCLRKTGLPFQFSASQTRLRRWLANLKHEHVHAFKLPAFLSPCIINI